jgi:hypothetical protein
MYFILLRNLFYAILPTVFTVGWENSSGGKQSELFASRPAALCTKLVEVSAFPCISAQAAPPLSAVTPQRRRYNP